MSFFSKRERERKRTVPATATGSIEDAPTPIAIDEEKGHSELHEDPAAPAASQHVDPAIEKAVVRKLDWRLPPLLGALCMFEMWALLECY